MDGLSFELQAVELTARAKMVAETLGRFADELLSGPAPDRVARIGEALGLISEDLTAGIERAAQRAK
ncbi:MAG TPA: hypothetical protein PLS95_14795 [Thermoanaerobaculales bacterium]|nr:hypothetical protein [Thermoanaerobaculales bacterium]HQN95697.1 hypothetical protein [Thermoanaerobaculales bacterium]HQP43717.1 hypothetical protein [Thermoanaerobaculales bacterium]